MIPRSLSVAANCAAVLVTLAGIPSLALSQQGAEPLSGRLTDPAGRALEGAVIRISGSPATVRTNRDGAFSLARSSSADGWLVARLLGFKPDSIRVTASMRTVQFTLDPWVFVRAVALMVGVSLIAGLVPAHLAATRVSAEAMRVD